MAETCNDFRVLARIWQERQDQKKAKPVEVTPPKPDRVALKRQVKKELALPKSRTAKVAAILTDNPIMLRHEIEKEVVEERAIKDWRRDIVKSAAKGEEGYGLPPRFKVELIDSRQTTDANGGIRADVRIIDTETDRRVTLNAISLGIAVRVLNELFYEENPEGPCDAEATCWAR